MVRVLMTVACSSCADVARTATAVVVYCSPFATEYGTKASKYTATGKPRRMQTRHMIVHGYSAAAHTSGQCRRRAMVIKSPVKAPVADETIAGSISRRPDEVALVKSTA
jgi:hypothetical protein